MTHEREIRAMLRSATKNKILRGWYFYTWGDETFWVITPPEGNTSTYNMSEIESYCRMLEMSEVQPLFRS